MPTSKAEFERLALARLAEARALFGASLFDGAFYLAGYSIECAPKAIYCKRFGGNELSDKQAVLDGYTHKLTDLVRLCGLDRAIGSAGSPRQRNWTVVTGWSETSRYSARTGREAQDLIDAIDDPVDGILRWLRSNW